MRFALIALLFTSCATPKGEPRIAVNISKQLMTVAQNGRIVANYPVSTSMFGEGDRPGSFKTPLGDLVVKEKIGEGLPVGAVFKYRHFTGEILPVNAALRNSIVTRIIRLDGQEPGNRNALNRAIYIHGTSFENRVGRKGSYGCVGMKSRDVIDLFGHVKEGTLVQIGM